LESLGTALSGKDLCSTANASKISVRMYTPSGYYEVLNSSFERAVDLLLDEDQAFALVPAGLDTAFVGAPGLYAEKMRFSVVWMPSPIVAFAWLTTHVHNFMSLRDVISPPLQSPDGFEPIELKMLKALISNTSSTKTLNRSKSSKLDVQGVKVTTYSAFAFKTWSHILAEGLAVTIEGDLGSQRLIREVITSSLTSTHHYAVVEQVGFDSDPEFVCLRESSKLEPVLPLSVANASLLEQMRARPLAPFIATFFHDKLTALRPVSRTRPSPSSSSSPPKRICIEVGSDSSSELCDQVDSTYPNKPNNPNYPNNPNNPHNPSNPNNPNCFSLTKPLCHLSICRAPSKREKMIS
jgi:hypothetical protein